jgi:hypothetical protein
MGRLFTDYDPILQQIDYRSQQSRERVRAIIREAGRPDILTEFDRNMKDLDTGITSARSVWHSISAAQRRALMMLADGYELRRMPASRTKYEGYCAVRKRDAIGYVCPIGTVRALCARELAHVNGGPLDPEKSIVVTERGQFIVKHGQQTAGA